MPETLEIGENICICDKKLSVEHTLKICIKGFIFKIPAYLINLGPSFFSGSVGSTGREQNEQGKLKFLLATPSRVAGIGISGTKI